MKKVIGVVVGMLLAVSAYAVVIQGESSAGVYANIKTDTNGNLLINAGGTASGDITDKSGTITAGGTAQQMAAANTSRHKVVIENIDATEDLWVTDDGTTAVVNGAGSWQIYAGGSFVSTSTKAISVIAATTGHKFTAKEY